jgi:hypothetical protein
MSFQEQLALALTRRLEGAASTLYTHERKTKLTPRGRSVFAVLSTAKRQTLVTVKEPPSGWPTPVVQDARSSARHGYMITGNQGTTLLDAARLVQEQPPDLVASPWPTPQVHDAKAPKTLEQITEMRLRAPKRSTGGPPGISNLNEAAELTMDPPAAWPTPNAACATRGGHLNHMDGRRSNLMDTAQLAPAPWATPVATELGNTLENYMAMKRNMTSGPRTAITHPSIQAQLVVSGEMPNGFPVSTESRGQLNPALPCWLQGLPEVWEATAPPGSVGTATRSVSPSRKRSLVR